MSLLTAFKSSLNIIISQLQEASDFGKKKKTLYMSSFIVRFALLKITFLFSVTCQIQMIVVKYRL